MPVVTFARIVAKEGSDLLDESTPAGKAYKNNLVDALAQPGCKEIHHGREVEDSKNYWIFAEWDSADARLVYQKTESYATVSKEMMPYVDLTSVFFKQFPPSSAGASASALFSTPDLGAIEVLSLYFPPDFTSEQKKDIEDAWDAFEKDGLQPASELRGVTKGWTLETDVPVLGGETPGEKGIAWVLLIGWNSVEGHMENRTRDHFKESIPKLLAKPRLGLNVVHVKPLAA